MTALGKGNGFGSSLYGNTRVEEGQQQPEHCLFPISCLVWLSASFSFVCQPLYHPFLLCQPERVDSSCPGARREEEARQKGPVALLGGCKPSLGSHCLYPHCQQRTGQPSLPAPSAAENELGRWQSVSETLQSQQKQLHAMSVSLTD